MTELERKDNPDPCIIFLSEKESRIQQYTDYFHSILRNYVNGITTDCCYAYQYIVKQMETYQLINYIYYYPILGILYFSYVQSFVYWLLLGIISSIGFGTGLHTGTLFLFPATIANRECIFSNLVRAAVWGSGTAIGEIPPYLAAQKIRLLNKKGEKQNELTSTSNLFSEYSKWGIVMVKEWIERYGFWAILVNASYPNMFFDILGLVCGYYGYGFWDFFCPTLLGKALVKAPIQVSVINYLAYTNSKYLDSMTIWTNDESGLATVFHILVAYYFLRMLIHGLAQEGKHFV